MKRVGLCLKHNICTIISIKLALGIRIPNYQNTQG